MTTTLVIGAGPIGTHVARTLEEAGRPVRLATRSGSGPDRPHVEKVRLDATDQAALRAALQDVDVVQLCVHASAYRPDVWERELPALERGVLGVAAELGVHVVFPESLYSFDTASTITESSLLAPPNDFGRIRARLLAARAASPARTTSVVAADYFGAGAGAAAHAGERMLQPATRGTTARPLGSADLTHAWTYLPDLGAAMVAAAALPPAPDRLLLAPSLQATQREMATAFARAAGRETARVRPTPSVVLRAIGLVHRPTAAVASTLHLFERPLVMDSTASEHLLGLAPTPLQVAAAATVAAAA